MNNLENRLQHIEDKLDNIALKSKVSNLDSDFAPRSDDEIDLRELWNVIWVGKFKIIAIATVFAVVSVIYVLTLPNKYQSDLVLAPSQADGKSGLGALATQYGGLAAMAGISLGGDSSRVTQAVKLVTSWPFLENVVNKYNLKPQIMAVDEWDSDTNQLIYNADIYDPETETWTREVDLGAGESPEPTSFETYKAFSKMIMVENEAKSGMLTLSVEYISPQIAYEWVNLLKQELNSFYQQQDIKEAQNNIEYLKLKIDETNVTDMQAVFYNMIESQTKTLMLAEVSDQYLVKTVIPAKVAEEKSSPKRAIICIFITLLGCILGTAYVLFSYLKLQKQSR